MQTKGMYRMSQRLGLRKAPRILDVDQAEEFVIEEEGKKKLCNKGTNNGDDPIIDPTSVYFGEHIYIKRLNNLYSHHGIRTGENSVIHYGGAFVDQNLIKKGAGRIYLSTLRSFASEEDVEKGRIIVRKYSACDPAPVTVARAIA